MARTIQNPLSESDIAFMELWKTKVLPNKHSIDLAVINQAAELIKFRRNGACSACNRNDVIEMNNIYGRLQGQYEGYLAALEQVAVKAELERKEEIKEKKIATRLETRNKKAAEYLEENGPKKPWKEKKNQDVIE